MKSPIKKYSLDSKSIGEQLKKIRVERDLSIREMSEICGLAVNTLSLLENGKTTPTINTLQNIANSLRIPITSFFNNKISELFVDFNKSFDRFEKSTTYGTFSALSTIEESSSIIEPYIVRISPTTEWGTGQIYHSGYEFVLCLKGNIDFTMSNEIFSLCEGDSLLFNSEAPHLMFNPNEFEASILLIFFPPRFKEKLITKHLYVQT